MKGTTINKLIKNKGLVIMCIGLLAGAFLLLYPTTPKNTANDTQTTNDDILKYRDNLEQKLTNIINNISGVSNTKVMITLKSGTEYIYASDASNDQEKHVVVDNELVYVKEYLPEIEGVAVVCYGGSDPIIKEKITNMVCSLLGLYSTQIRRITYGNQITLHKPKAYKQQADHIVQKHV